MENEPGECLICYEEIKEKCTTRCQHSFCKQCIVQVLLTRNFKCPYCRAEISGYSITLENGNPLLVQPTTIFGQVYIQANTEGLASYHFNSSDDCYISYESPDCIDWPNLSDGSRPPHKKPFEHMAYNEETRTFTGIIVWSPITWEDDGMWVYSMVFSEDFASIMAGTVVTFDENKKYTGTEFFNEDLMYERLTKNLYFCSE